jgi:hypothetical protein
MGISDLRDLNLCLLAPWVQRYQDGEGKLWRSIVDFKYNGYVAQQETTRPFEKWLNGRLKLLSWDIVGKWVMTKRLDSGKTSGLVVTP